jgi:integrase
MPASQETAGVIEIEFAGGGRMRITGTVEAPTVSALMKAHGLRKAALTRLADAGKTIHQIAAVSGHKTLREIERYTRAANQRRLAREALLGDQNGQRRKA